MAGGITPVTLSTSKSNGEESVNKKHFFNDFKLNSTHGGANAHIAFSQPSVFMVSQPTA